MIGHDFLKQCLCPAGDGVYAVTTARDRKKSLQSKLYGDTGDVHRAWYQHMDTLSGREVLLLGVPSDCGGGILRGANWGPLALREAFYSSFDDVNVFDLGDVRVIPQLLLDEYLSSELITRCQQALYQQENSSMPVSPLSITREVCDILYLKYPDARLMALGGDHSVSYPLVKSFLRAKKRQGKKVGVIHFDAHTDLLHERLGIPVNFATWVTHVLPDMIHPECWVQLGIRATGKSQEHWQSTFNIKQYWAAEMCENGAIDTAKQIIDHVSSFAIDEWYLTFDIDALDISYASATGTPEAGGLHPEDAITIIQLLGDHAPITGCDLVEVAPFTQPHGEGSQNQTIQTASNIMKTLFDSLSQSLPK